MMTKKMKANLRQRFIANLNQLQSVNRALSRGCAGCCAPASLPRLTAEKNMIDEKSGASQSPNPERRASSQKLAASSCLSLKMRFNLLQRLALRLRQK